MQFKQYITTSRKHMPMIQSGKQTIYSCSWSADISNMKRAHSNKKENKRKIEKSMRRKLANMRKSSPSLGQKTDLEFQQSEWKNKENTVRVKSTCRYERSHVLLQEV